MQTLKTYELKGETYDVTQIIEATRYVDDLQVFLAVDKIDNESTELVCIQNMIKTIKYLTYHHDMDLKEENLSGK